MALYMVQDNKHLLKGGGARAFLDTNEQVRNFRTCSPSEGGGKCAVVDSEGWANDL